MIRLVCRYRHSALCTLRRSNSTLHAPKEQFHFARSEGAKLIRPTLTKLNLLCSTDDIEI
jgi:hypothetical protein